MAPAVACKVIALSATCSDARTAPALHSAHRGVVANSTRLPHDPWPRLLQESHRKWFEPAFPWTSLPPLSVTTVGAMRRAGRFSPESECTLVLQKLRHALRCA